MGADLLVQFIDWKEGKTHQETELHFGKMVADIEQRIHDIKELGEDYENLHCPPSTNKKKYAKQLKEYKDELLEALEKIKEAKKGTRDSTVIKVGNRLVLLTGGMSWGDAPSETYESIDKLFSAGVILGG